jgi:hypothetical protein
VEGQENNPVRSLATALPTGALASEPAAEQAALDEEPAIPPFLQRTEPKIELKLEPKLELDHLKVLYEEGIPILKELTGRRDLAIRGLIKGWLRNLDDDPKALMDLISHANTTVKPADIVQWLHEQTSPRNRGVAA